MLIVLLGLSVFLNLIIILLVLKNNNGSNSKNELNKIENSVENLRHDFKEEMSLGRDESSRNLKYSREETSSSIKDFSDSITKNMTSLSMLQKSQLDTFSKELSKLTTMNEEKMNMMRDTIEEKMNLIQENNNKKLDEMRETVDEKLHVTLEKRLGESFKLVSERLEMVYKGLGEMKNLASGVGDLKKVLTNVKVRGTWGEIQLKNLLEQVFSNAQYDENVVTKKGSRDRVEYALKIPSKTDENEFIYLPIDSKFPIEDYSKLIDASQNGDKEQVQILVKNIETRIKSEASDIKEKYLDPPNTTDFGIMFLPIEGLYAEVLKINGLAETLQRDYRVVVTGPTTLLALLSSFQMGFKTLAIQKRSSEVWELLGAVKTEFCKFADILDKTQKKLQEASHSIEKAAVRSRSIERKLRKVEELPTQEAKAKLEFEDDEDDIS